MADVSAFTPWVAPHAYGATDDLIRRYVVDAAIEFCDKTGVVQHVSVVDIVSGEPEYPVPPITSLELAAVKAVFFGSRELPAAAPDEVRHGAAVGGDDTDAEARVGDPEVYYQPVPDAHLRLWPVPDRSVARWLTVRASYRPARGAAQLPDVLFNDYAQDIANGALSNLLVIPGQPFSNPTLAETLGKRFAAAINAAAVEARRGQVRSSMRVKPRAFA